MDKDLKFILIYTLIISLIAVLFVKMFPPEECKSQAQCRAWELESEAKSYPRYEP